MKCDERNIERYLNSELDAQKAQEFQVHIAQCQNCQKLLDEITKVNNLLNAYTHETLDIELENSLSQIQNTTHKRFSLFHLFPRELAISAASVLLALCAGALFSLVALSQNDQFTENDFFEQVSLASLITE